MPSPPGHNVLFGNANQGRAATAPLSLQLINSRSLGPGSGTSTLSDFVTVKAYLGDLYDVWQTGGGFGVNVVSNSNEKSITFDGSNTLQLDSLRMDSGAIYNIRFEIILNEGVDGSEMQKEVIQLRQLMMDTFRVDSFIDTVMMMPIGGYAFTVKYDGSPNPGGV